jgi:hypothetical protein
MVAMMSDTMWLVEFEEGEYSDYTHQVVGVAGSKEKAIALAKAYFVTVYNYYPISIPSWDFAIEATRYEDYPRIYEIQYDEPRLLYLKHGDTRMMLSEFTPNEVIGAGFINIHSMANEVLDDE